MPRTSDLIKRVASVAIIAGVAFFFFRALKRNWNEIQAAKLEFHYPLLLTAALFMLACYLLSTYAWHATVNALSIRKLSFAQSVATFNASSLTKYLPGKFWSYALQMYWLGGVGFSKSLVMYANIVNLVISIVTTILAGLVCLLFSSSNLPPAMVLGALSLVLVGGVGLVRFSGAVFRALVTLASRWLKRDVRYFELSLKVTLELHVIHLLSAVAAGASTYFVCLGIGYWVGPRDAALVMASSLISDVAGVLAFIVPAGLGVREGIMYLMLDGVSLGALSLVLPIASRGVNMVVDLGLGAFALRLLRRFMGEGFSSPPP